MKAVVIGYGNVLRGDDAAGPAVAEAIQAMAFPDVCVAIVPQLTPELAEVLADAEHVIFVDACVATPDATPGATVTVAPVAMTTAAEPVGHIGDPGCLLALCHALHGSAPVAHVVMVPAVSFEVGALSPVARQGCGLAVREIHALLQPACPSLSRCIGSSRRWAEPPTPGRSLPRNLAAFSAFSPNHTDISPNRFAGTPFAFQGPTPCGSNDTQSLEVGDDYSNQPFRLLTARDLMTRDLLLIPKEATLRHAHMLASQVSGAGRGRHRPLHRRAFTTDFMRWMDDEQRRPRHEMKACCCSDWEMLAPEELPTDEVGTFMTTDPVTATPETRIAELSRLMLDAHIHRVIVVDPESRPIGVVTTTDVLAAVARAAEPV